MQCSKVVATITSSYVLRPGQPKASSNGSIMGPGTRHIKKAVVGDSSWLSATRSRHAIFQPWRWTIPRLMKSMVQVVTKQTPKHSTPHEVHGPSGDQANTKTQTHKNTKTPKYKNTKTQQRKENTKTKTKGKENANNTNRQERKTKQKKPNKEETKHTHNKKNTKVPSM